AFRPEPCYQQDASARLFDLLAAIHAPQLVLLHIAVEAVDGQLAPLAVARDHIADHPRLELGHHTRAVRTAASEWHGLRTLGPGADEHGAPAAQQAVEHPAVRPFAVAHAAPVVGLGDDLDGQTRPGKDPDDGLIGARSPADIDLVGFE